jgi:hypothetical protein
MGRIIKSRQMVLAEHIAYRTDKPCTENSTYPEDTTWKMST